MILVTGSPRSGTSMWMQILRAAGLPVLGDELPRVYRHIADANPAGFYESRLRGGVYFATNPDPASGTYLHPESTRRHVLKVFIPGLVRTDHAFLDHVITTIRPWREFVVSNRLLRQLEIDGIRGDPGGASLERRERSMARIVSREERWPAPIAWWFDVYEILRDAGTRQYPMHLVPYTRLLADPRGEIREVLRWLGGGDLEAAVGAVRPALRHHHDPDIDVSPIVDGGATAVFDEVYAALCQGSLDPDLIQRMNALHRQLGTKWKRPQRYEENNGRVEGIEGVPDDSQPTTPSDPRRD